MTNTNLIKELYEKLDDNQKKLLKYAFENHQTQLVEIDGKFIGVNVVATDSIIKLEESGYWSAGELHHG